MSNLICDAKEKKCFSVLMSVYKKEDPKYLKSSIESLLNQTVVPNEIVIVRDGKLTKELNDVLAEYENNHLFVICGYDKNMGLGYALNYGVLKCSNEIIARMDSDDVCDRFRFEKQLEVLVNSDYSLIGSNTKEFIDNINNVVSVRIMPESDEAIRKYSHKRNPFIHPSIMTYRSVLLSVGNYHNCYLCEDYDMWTRVIEANYKCYNIQDFLVYMRVSKDFYKRRGGLKYCKAIVSFKSKLYKKGYMSRKEYIKTKYATIFVSLMPGFLREFIYKKFLRKCKNAN